GFSGLAVEPQVNYTKTLAKHRFDVLLGASWQGERMNAERLEAHEYSSEALLHTPAGASLLLVNTDYSQYRYQSVFGRINYQYQGKYLANFTARRDGSSRFGPGNRFANFGAVGLAWVFSEEAVREAEACVSFGHLGGSYGLTGYDKIGGYQYLVTYGQSGPYQGINGLAPERLYNPTYGWESNRKLEFAGDVGLWNDRLLLSASWF